jgi:steroid delta-isomerase-like uncharacterized protein
MANKTLSEQDFVKLIYKLWNEGNEAVVEDLLAPGFVRYEPFYGPIKGREAMAKHVTELRTQYPDLQIELDQVLFDGRSFVTHWRYAGTFLGAPSDGSIEPTGKTADYYGASFSHIKDGKLADEYVYYNVLDVLQQIGVMPEVAI